MLTYVLLQETSASVRTKGVSQSGGENYQFVAELDEKAEDLITSDQGQRWSAVDSACSRWNLTIRMPLHSLAACRLWSKCFIPKGL